MKIDWSVFLMLLIIFVLSGTMYCVGYKQGYREGIKKEYMEYKALQDSVHNNAMTLIWLRAAYADMVKEKAVKMNKGWLR